MSDLIREEIEKELKNLGLLEEDLVDALECLVFLRDKLKPAVEELFTKNLSPAIAIANDQDAIMAVDEITDRVVNRQGILEKAMMGEDIHDLMANIKAKIESLIVGSAIEARTIEKMKEATKKMRSTSRHKIEGE